MTKLFYIRTNGFDLVASVDEDDITRVMTENDCFPKEKDEKSINDFLNSIEDNSSWKIVDTMEWWTELATEIRSKDILAKIKKEL